MDNDLFTKLLAVLPEKPPGKPGLTRTMVAEHLAGGASNGTLTGMGLGLYAQSCGGLHILHLAREIVAADREDRSFAGR